MTRVKSSEFPELKSVFSGYLHEDFLEEHASPAAALRAFEADADAGERRRFHAEARRFLEKTSSLDFTRVVALLGRLGCRWTPPSREALVAWLSARPGGESDT